MHPDMFQANKPKEMDGECMLTSLFKDVIPYLKMCIGL